MIEGFKKQKGGALIGLTLVVVLVAAIYFGSSFFLQKETPSEKSIKLLKEAQERVATINGNEAEHNQELKEELEIENKEDVKVEEVLTSDDGIEVSEEEKETVKISETDLDTAVWQELVRENEGIKIKFHKDWYFTVNRVEAAQNGYDMIIGFETDPNIWEKMPPFAVELLIASENMNDDYAGYVKELGIKNGKKYILRTENEETYRELIDSMANTLEFID